MAQILPGNGKKGFENRGKMDLHILAVDDSPEFLLFLKVGLQNTCRLTTAQNLTEAFAILAPNGIDMVLLDVGLGLEDGLEVLKQIKARDKDLDVVMMSGQKDPKLIVEAIRHGAADYLVKPFEIDELLAVIERVRPYRRIREMHAALVEGMNRSQTTLIGASAPFRAVLETIGKIKGRQVSVVIEGESGTGKELLARELHRLENDPRRPFVAVNCAAIPEPLLESELFGHEKGSFTGAYTRKIGKFELAHGGDIFLDEVSSLKWDLQAKLLRALQEREFTRVGGTEPIQIEFRVIAASNEDLEKLVAEGKLRRDLYHRLRVIALQVPPLRDRRGDIPRLVENFLNRFEPQGNRRFNREAMEVLEAYAWPGNIRELENLVHSLVILVSQPEIRKEDLPEWVFRKTGGGIAQLSTNDFVLPSSRNDLIPLKDYIGMAEKAYIQRALEITKGDKSKAAALLDMSRTRLYERLKGWGMDEE